MGNCFARSPYENFRVRADHARVRHSKGIPEYMHTSSDKRQKANIRMM